MNLHHRPRPIVLLALIFGVLPAAALPPEQVEQMIVKGKKFLYSQQKNGTWELVNDGDYGPKGKHRGGLTAVATLALLAAGEDPQDPKLAKAIEYLKGADMVSVYALGCRAQIWLLLPPSPEVKKLAKRDGQLLLNQIKGTGEALGLFYYPATPDDKYDLSISQYGVLGLWAVDQLGAEVPNRAWEAMDAAWRAKQFPDGGWCYIKGHANAEGVETPSMAAAGIATLFITHDYVKAGQYLGCTGNREDAHITRGIDWMTKNFNKVYDFGIRGGGIPYYTLYGIERIGVAAGLKYFGKVDWFDSGADFLAKRQNGDGSWGGGTGDVFGHNNNNIPTTSFSLLFLARGRSPVIVNKLRYDPPVKGVNANWNQRPRDMANLVQWLGRGIERPLNWQITNLDAPVDELLDAPVLYISGTQALAFGEEQESKLRRFVEDGGMILAHADCNSEAFGRSFQKLGLKLFPAYEFRELPEDHPLYTSQQYHYSTFKNKPALSGISNGAREMMILVSNDPARIWQTPFDGRLEPYALGANILLYAVDKKGLLHRNQTWLVRPKADAKTSRSLALARLSFPGNWNPEPGGWRRMAAILRNEAGVDLKMEEVALGEGKLCQPPPPPPKIDAKELRTKAFKRIAPEKIAATAGDTAAIEKLIQDEMKKLEKEILDAASASAGRNSLYSVAHLTGTGAYKFTEAQIKELKEFVQGGGTLIVDSAGGSGDFAESAEAALAAAFNNDSSLRQAMPADHPIFKGLPADLYRAWTKKRLGNLKAPRLRALEINNRKAVFFSHEDLSAGLVGNQVDGITGYTPAAATMIVKNILTGK